MLTDHSRQDNSGVIENEELSGFLKDLLELVGICMMIMISIITSLTTIKNKKPVGGLAKSKNKSLFWTFGRKGGGGEGLNVCLDGLGHFCREEFSSSNGHFLDFGGF